MSLYKFRHWQSTTRPIRPPGAEGPRAGASKLARFPFRGCKLGQTSNMQFWKPGTVAPGSSLDRATETEENVLSSAPSTAAISVQSARERLPIHQHSTSDFSMRETELNFAPVGEKILHCIETYGVTILVGQTGCGKTTRQ